MNTDDSSWVEQAAGLPVAFAQVREDPWLDLWVVEKSDRDARVCMVASGGCTAALLCASPNIGQIRLVDPNPAQLALARLKLRLTATREPVERMQLLGHAPLPAATRQARLASELDALGLVADVLGPVEFVAEVGPDHAGRYERVFAELRKNLADKAEPLQAALSLNDLAEQERRFAPETPLGHQLDAALDAVMALPNLVRLFGEEATKNPVEPFSRHFARRIRHVLATLPANCNPYLWQMLLGQYPPVATAPWLTAPSPKQLPDVTWTKSFMTERLADVKEAFDFVHLSNILDWLTPEKAQATLDLAWQALRPGGWLLIRQLNSTLDIPRLGPRFDWLIVEAESLHTRDRSFFYRAIHLARKR